MPHSNAGDLARRLFETDPTYRSLVGNLRAYLEPYNRALLLDAVILADELVASEIVRRMAEQSGFRSRKQWQDWFKSLENKAATMVDEPAVVTPPK